MSPAASAVQVPNITNVFYGLENARASGATWELVKHGAIALDPPQAA